MSDEDGLGPENEKDRPDDEPERPGEKDGESVAPGAVFAKKMLEQRGTCWLFQVTENGRSYYTVECGDQVWKFGLYFSARGKFERLVANDRRVV
jgi:hypothetical protein